MKLTKLKKPKKGYSGKYKSSEGITYHIFYPTDVMAIDLLIKNEFIDQAVILCSYYLNHREG